MSTSVANSRIAKNTLMMFLRMFFTMAVTLYTSRVILQALGIEDFGIYNVVGGVVSMLSFINSTLIGASSRFITYALGTNDDKEIQRTFNCVVTIHYVFSALILILAETIGLWFVMNKLNVPIERVDATMWVYQCSVLAAIITFISTPYNSLIVAHEKMSTFAYVSIIEKIAQLAIVYVLFIVTSDKLVTYAILIVIVQICIRLIYTTYCKRSFKESHSKFLWDREKLKEIFIYAGWIFNGNLAFLGYTQGLNILLNIYFGPIVNAARGLSVQVQHAILNFTNNFQMAVNPQIIKSYAHSDYTRMHQLVLISSRLGFYMMLFVVVPLYVNIDLVLNLWLTEVPEYTSSFVRIMLILGLNSTLRNPTITAVQATGDVKKFQIWEGGILLTILPVAWILLELADISAVSVLCVYMFIELFVQFIRVYIVYPQINLSRKIYFTKVLYPCLLLSVIIMVIAFSITSIYEINSFIKLILYILFNSVILLVLVYMLGISKYERSIVNEVVNKHIHRLLKK